MGSDKIDKEFSRLQDHEFAFKPDLWDDLEQKLDGKDIRKRKYIWLYAGIPPLVILLSVFFWFSEPILDKPNETIVTNNKAPATIIQKDKKSDKRERVDNAGVDNKLFSEELLNKDRYSLPKDKPMLIRGNKPYILADIMEAYELFNIKSRQTSTIRLRQNKRNERKVKGRKPPIHLIAGVSNTKNINNDEYNSNLLVGFGLHKVLSNNTTINGELIYINRRGYDLQQNTTQVKYFLEREEIHTQLATSGMKYIQMPLYIEYKLVNRLNVKAGAYWDILLSTDSEITKTKNGEVASERRNSVFKGMNYNSGGLMLGANYYVANSLSIDVRYNQNLISGVDKNYYKSKQTNSELQVALKLDL